MKSLSSVVICMKYYAIIINFSSVILAFAYLLKKYLKKYISDMNIYINSVCFFFNLVKDDIGPEINCELP